MSDGTESAVKTAGEGSWSAIRRRARERDIRRLISLGRLLRSFAGSGPGRTPEGAGHRLAEYLKMLLGAALAFWLLAALLSYLFGAGPVYTLSAFGLLFSSQAAYYKLQVQRDPDFRIRRCGCAGGARDDTEAVLRSAASAVLGIPNSVFGAVFYAVLAVLEYGHLVQAMVALAALALAANAWLAWVMIARIGRLCTICVNLAALNALLLWEVVH